MKVNKMRIVIVDDERRIREGLVRHIEKIEGEYQIAGVFSNGREALEYIASHEVDIVITDIKMPFMDGLEVSRVIRAKYPMIKVIILSGYCEFEYARRSMQYGVSDFLAKPVKLDTLKETLEKVSHELKMSRQAREDQREQEQLLDQYRGQILRAYMNDTANSVSAKSNQFFSKNMQAYRVLFLEGSPDTMLRFFEEASCPELFLQYYEVDQGKYCMLLEYRKLDEEERIMQKLSLLNGGDFILGISKRKIEEQDLSQACQEALSACRLSWYQEGKIFWAEKMPKRTGTVHVSTEQIIASVFSGNEEACRKELETLKREVLEKHADVLTLHSMLLEILQKINKEAERLGLEADEKTYNELWEILSIENVDIVFSNISKYFMHIQQMIRQVLAYRNGKKIREVIVYINEHLNEDIALQDVCDYVGISSGYLSRIFKEKTGYNFVDYVNRTKIEKAKKMLTESEMTAVEIAKYLSFNDDKYFIRLFKKIVGMTPGTYRKVSR